MKKLVNRICICGHLEIEHGVFKFDSYGFVLPKACLVNVDNDIKFVDFCREFRLDNLKYLEKLSE